MKRSWVLVVAAMAVVLAACSSSDIAENIIESQDGVGDVEIDEDSGEVSIESDDGSLTIGGGEIPDGFPVDLPGGGEVTAVVEATGSSTVSVEYTDSYASIMGFYEDWVESSALEVQFTSETGDPPTRTWSLGVGDSGFYSITVAEESSGDKVSVLITVQGDD